MRRPRGLPTTQKPSGCIQPEEIVPEPWRPENVLVVDLFAERVVGFSSAASAITRCSLSHIHIHTHDGSHRGHATLWNGFGAGGGVEETENVE